VRLIISERLISIVALVGACPICTESTAYVTEIIFDTGEIEYYCPHCRTWLGRMAKA
jgi:transposase-like protein